MSSNRGSQVWLNFVIKKIFFSVSVQGQTFLEHILVRFNLKNEEI